MTTKEEVTASGANQYRFPTKDTVFKGRLDSRSWGKNCSLVCNFTASDGRKIKLIGYRHNGVYEHIYGPKKGEFNFTDDFLEGMTFTCTVKMNNKGRHVWEKAE